MRRLILETTPGLVELGMPAGDGVAAGDWDGSVRTAEATAWVADGLSVWELSVNSSPNTKADDDYSKRTDTPDGAPTSDCTYVEAILRPWTARARWATGKRSEKVWKDVKALGLDDIETWLEAAPITWAWLSEELGLSPYGLRTGLTWWRDWAAQTNPALTPEVVLAGRTEAAEDLEERLASSGSVTTVAGASMEEVCAFIDAIAVKLDEQGKGQMLARLAFVDDVSTWRQLTALSQPLILVPRTPELASEIPAGTVHNFCVPVISTEGSDVTLPALDAAEVATALKSAGFTDRDKTDALGRLARRSLTGLRRNLAVKAVLHRPTWADASPSRNFRSILLAGSWGDNVEGDRSILEALTGTDYESFREEITGIADSPTDPLAIRTDGAWHLVSAVDAWMLLVSKLTHDDMMRFETIVEMVLAEGDPALELPRDQRWRAPIDGKTRRYSGDLRRGLAQSLALLGIYGGTVALPGGASGSDFANYLVRKLLEWASADGTGQAWQSIADILPLLAEAGPDAFLDGVGAAAAGDNPLLGTMFQDHADESGFFSGGTPHSNLLWALECVSWSPDHFGRAVDLLARLDEIDPGGRMTNRPAASLAAIFRPWHPDNSVDPDRRIAVLDTLRHRHPDAAWKLESSMLPENHGTHFPISVPAFRTWKPEKLSVTYGEIWKMTTAAVERCIKDAGEDAQRWSTILAHTSDLPPADRERVVAALDSMADQSEFASDFRDTLWRTLVDLIGHHREFPDAAWVLPDEELGKLDALAARYRPKSVYLRLVGLFQSWTPYVGARRLDDYEGFERELGRQRIEAIKEIEAEGGFDAITRLARDASVPGSVGIALANVGSSHDEELLGWLAAEDQDLVSTAMSYFSARYSLEGFELITGLLERDDLTVDQRARLLLVARDNLPEAWALAAADPELETGYWAAFQPLGLGQDFDKIDEVADRLIQAGRHADVLHLMSMYSHIDKDGPRPQAAELIVRALDGLLAHQAQSAAARDLSTYDFQQLFAYLEAMREHLEPGDLVRLQWSYLPALGYDAKVPALSESLAADPAEFVGVVCTVYRARPKSEDEEVAEDQAGEEQRDASMATNAYRLLNAWDSPPGLVDGVMNAEVLRAWIDSAMELLAEGGRTEVGLQHIGQVLGHTPPDADGTWPGFVVRDLLEEVQLDHVETGLYLQIVNSRGFSSRGLEDGGEQELKLAEDYRAKAEALADEAPRVASLFRRVAGSYESYARRNEGDAERFRRGLH
ncbi:hypothetical protein Bequi_04855 [Brachybacterium sp. JHP9]|uniref:XRE family transcriptional regulator n=1 Tax=Brachybacterium equifaecis TaxID=2910770 RepID=A0ABT0QYJ1_9MICO|nr:hypothetical protein [Brachybacterium equifaecis]MCL6422721.1 hypothetical protein [Brachybacterium equifaecis]